jgi:hypothetical protein
MMGGKFDDNCGPGRSPYILYRRLRRPGKHLRVHRSRRNIMRTCVDLSEAICIAEAGETSKTANERAGAVLLYYPLPGPRSIYSGTDHVPQNFKSPQCAPQTRQSMQSLCCHRHLHQKSQCPQMPENNKFMRNKLYVSAVGALMYLAIATRPDIAHAVGVLCRFMSKLGPAHWKAAKHLFCYLCGSVDYHLTYAVRHTFREIGCAR